jgi:hypothetical protein
MRTFWLLVLGFTLFTAAAFGEDQPWKPVTPADLSVTPSVDQSADAEALFWDIRIEQSEKRTVLSHYIRIKIFTEHGVETQGRVDLEYGGRNSIKDISGRTIQADGSIIELKPDTIFERTIAKTKKYKAQAKSFALPSVKPGVLIEYRWTEVEEIEPLFLPLSVQRDIPVQLVHYSIKPLPSMISISSLEVAGFNVHLGPRDFDKQKHIVGDVTNIPAFHPEPLMPPEAAARGWLLIYYDSRDIWKEYGRYDYEAAKSRMKVTDEIRREATRIVGDASTEEAKIRRIYEFCRTEIRRFDDDDGTEDIQQRVADQAKENKTAADTLKRKAGTGRDIDLLFAALATAAGFEAKYARVADRGRFFFDERFPTPYMLTSYDIAVRIGSDWSYFDPAGRYLPFGMLRWQEEGVPALLADPMYSPFRTTTSSTAEKSLTMRTMTGRLDPDGTLEGDVRIVFFGHSGADEKEEMDGLSPNEREEIVKTSVQTRMKAAEISNVQFKNVSDREEPIIESYHVRIPGYAQRIGKRLFFEPNYFQHGRPPLLTASTRVQPVYFPYPWVEDDTVVIEWPAGFELDNADQPPHEATAGSSIKHEMSISAGGRTLRFTRRFSFGLNKKILYSASEYPYLKAAFEAIAKRDNHTLAIKEATEEEKR